jgi:hypothetical protein
VDRALSKRVPVRGNVKLNFRIEAYNLLNGMNSANPSTTIGASDLGQVLHREISWEIREIKGSKFVCTDPRDSVTLSA